MAEKDEFDDLTAAQKKRLAEKFAWHEGEVIVRPATEREKESIKPTPPPRRPREG